MKKYLLILLLTLNINTAFAVDLKEARSLENAGKWEESFEAYSELASKGNPDALFKLADFYERAIGTKPDMKKVVSIYEQLSQMGFGTAEDKLGAMYLSGKNIRPDSEKAFYWYNRAANKGIIDSQLRLATMYMEGQGTKPDISETYKWLAIASSKGSETAKKAIKVLDIKLPKELVEQGKKKAEEFKKTHEK